MAKVKNSLGHRRETREAEVQMDAFTQRAKQSALDVLLLHYGSVQTIISRFVSIADSSCLKQWPTSSM
jgi:hypothetical protein